jgi:hypothetical protein
MMADLDEDIKIQTVDGREIAQYENSSLYKTTDIHISINFYRLSN